MSGGSPPLYCTLTLIAMQGHQKNINNTPKTIMSYTSTHGSTVVIYYFIGYKYKATTVPLVCPYRGGPRSASGRITRAKTTLQRRRHEPEPRIDGEPGFDRYQVGVTAIARLGYLPSVQLWQQHGVEPQCPSMDTGVMQQRRAQWGQPR